MSKQTILTGIRSNSEPTLGNYLGAILPIIDMAKKHADEYTINMFVPDLHSFTTPIDHTEFYERTINNLRLFVACGLPMDHENVNIYRQSRISAHSELMWILSCFTGFGEMGRMVEFKEKADRLKEERVSVGLFTYPILMAADILLYNAKWVPVGEDQRQHLEFARDIAMRINNQFGQFNEIFTVPETIVEQQKFVDRDSAPRIRSLKDPSKKMSKSISEPAGTIQLSDNPKEAAKKVMGATTDSVGAVHFDWEGQPGITNLLQILSLLSGVPQQQVTAQWTGNERYGDLKKAVAEAVESTLESIQSKMQSIDAEALLSKLERDEQSMNILATETLLRAQKAIGLRE